MPTPLLHVSVVVHLSKVIMKARSEATTALLSHEVDIGLSLSADLNSG